MSQLGDAAARINAARDAASRDGTSQASDAYVLELVESMQMVALLTTNAELTSALERYRSTRSLQDLRDALAAATWPAQQAGPDGSQLRAAFQQAQKDDNLMRRGQAGSATPASDSLGSGSTMPSSTAGGLFGSSLLDPGGRLTAINAFQFKVVDLSINVATIDDFDFDSAAVKKAHGPKLDDAASFIKALLASGFGLVEVIGYTDAVGPDDYNDTLGQQRADAVKGALMTRGLDAFYLWTSTKGEHDLVVQTQAANAKNRRVEIRYKPLPPIALPDVPASPPGIGLPPIGPPPNGTPTPNWFPQRPLPNIPMPDPNWLKRALENDPLLRQLPPWMRDKAIDGLKDADEAAAKAIIDALPLDPKIKAALKATVQGLLQLGKGKKWTPPVPPPPQYEQPPSSVPNLGAPPPGVFNLPTIKW